MDLEINARLSDGRSLRWCAEDLARWSNVDVATICGTEPVDGFDAALTAGVEFIGVGVRLRSALECALSGGQLTGWELTEAAGLSKGESHGQAPHPQH